jgi:hypothetical protein
MIYYDDMLYLYIFCLIFLKHANFIVQNEIQYTHYRKRDIFQSKIIIFNG